MIFINDFTRQRYAAVFLLFIVPIGTFAQKTFRLSSPDENILFVLHVSASGIRYNVAYKSYPLVHPSHVGVFTKNTIPGALVPSLPVYTDSVETYNSPTGKTSRVTHRYRQMVVRFRRSRSKHDIWVLTVRAFNDGLALRYGFPKQPNADSLLLTDEQTEFRLAGQPLVKALLLPNYTTSHEGLYTTQPFGRLPQDTLADMPLLVQYPNKTFMAITEAALLDYAGMYLMKSGDRLVSKLSPLPNGDGLKVRAALPHQSPWRVLMIGDRLGTLMESNLLTTLCPPQKQIDWSWLTPGTSTFPWWNGNVLPDTVNAPGINFATQRHYIDFCARNNITYHSVVEYGLRPWYTDDGVNFQPGPNPDVTKPVPGLDMKQVCDYARGKGVGIRVWVHWAALYPKLDSAFAQFGRWGIKGMMVDFMDRDDQEMVNIQTEILEKAAKHKLHIQFHGAYKPTGLQRTYPNELTREGALNYEVHKWEKKVTPDHDLNVVFTRGLAGPTDYHLGGFRAVPDSLFRAQYTKPLMLGTRTHSLAMYVVLESGLQMVCDYPEAYEVQPGFSFLKNLPTVWDETKVLDAVPDSHACVARRKGDAWYVGAINNGKAKTLSVPLDFLAEGDYDAEIFHDAQDAAIRPDGVQVANREANKSVVLNIAMAAGGGIAAVFKRK